MEINANSSCCAMRDIDGLSEHQTGSLAMESFCEWLWGDDDMYHDEYYSGGQSHAHPSAFYTFTGVIKHTDKSKPGPPQKGLYGPNFAAYIRRHKLGQVVASVARPNRVNHPDHVVRVWVWAPNETNLRAWWYKIKPKTNQRW